MLAAFLRDVLPHARLEKETMAAIKHHSGADEKTISQGLMWNSGPEVQVTMLIPHETNGHTSDASGGYRSGSNIIQVATMDVGRSRPARTCGIRALAMCTS